MSAGDWGVVFDEVLILAIATFLLLKGIMLRRRTRLGRAFARNNFAMALAYYGAALGLHFEVFTSNLWRWPVRLLVAYTAGRALHEMAQHYGGWRELGWELGDNLREFRDTWRRVGRRGAIRLRGWLGLH